MRLSNAAVYAVQALVYLSGRPKDDQATGDRLAEATGAPAGFLSRLATHLVRAGILVGARGPTGGYWLARPPGSVTLLEIVEAVDGPYRGVAQPVCSGGLDQRLQAVADLATDAERRQLAGVTLADLAGGKGKPRKGA